MFIDGDVCPVCHESQFVTNWKGRLFVMDANKSEIAKKVGLSVAGEYAIKVA